MVLAVINASNGQLLITEYLHLMHFSTSDVKL